MESRRDRKQQYVRWLMQWHVYWFFLLMEWLDWWGTHIDTTTLCVWNLFCSGIFLVCTRFGTSQFCKQTHRSVRSTIKSCMFQSVWPCFMQIKHWRTRKKIKTDIPHMREKLNELINLCPFALLWMMYNTQWHRKRFAILGRQIVSERTDRLTR